MNDTKKREIKKAVFFVIENVLKEGQEIDGYKFRELVNKYCGRDLSFTYIASVLRPIWTYNQTDSKTCAVICVSRSKGIYKKISVEEYNKNYAHEKKVLVPVSRFNELLEIEKSFKGAC